MTVNFKSDVTSANTNSAYVSKTANDEKTGTLALNDGGSTAITDTQDFINQVADTSGETEGDATRKTYSSEQIIANGDNKKVAIGKLDAQSKINLDNIANHETRVTDIENDYGVANGLATLDGSGLVPAGQLPSYVDDVLEYANFAAFPVTGETGKIYIAIDTGFTYRWTGSVYVDITSKVDSVNTQVGAVVLDTDDIIEGDNNLYAIKHERNASVPPTVNEDSGDGYEIGSTWFDSVAGKKYVLQDATVGAAVWIETGGVGGGGGLDVFYTEQFEINLSADITDSGNDVALITGTIAGTLADETTNQIKGVTSLKYTQAAGSLNDFFFLPDTYTTELKDKNNDAGLNFYFKYDGLADDIAVVVYDVTNSTILTSSLDLLTSETDATRYSTSYFVPDTCNEYKIGFHVKAENIGAVLIVDEIEGSLNPFVVKNLMDEPEEYRVNGILAFASSNTKCAYYSTLTNEFTTLKKYGTITNSSADGFYFTATKKCLFNGTYTTFDVGADSDHGLAKNLTGAEFDTDVRTNITNIGPERIFAYRGDNTGAGLSSGSTDANGSVVLEIGDTVHLNHRTSIYVGGTGYLYPRLNFTVSDIEGSEHVITPAKSNATDWIDTGALIIGATTTAPTKGTIVRDKVWAKRVGSDMEVRVEYRSLIAGAAAGSGDYLFEIPRNWGGYSNLEIDTDVLNVHTGSVVTVESSIIGKGWSVSSINNAVDSTLMPYDSTQYRIANSANTVTGTTAWVSSTWFDLADANHVTYSHTYKVPIKGWISASQFLAAIPIQKTAYIKDVKTANTAGGGGVTSWGIRALNTLEGDTDFISLSSNQFTLAKGKYEFEATSPFYGGLQQRTKLRNITDSSDDLLSDNSYGEDAVDADGGLCTIKGQIEITDSKTYEVQHRSGFARATNGWGFPANFGVDEVYTQVKITKVR